MYPRYELKNNQKKTKNPKKQKPNNSRTCVMTQTLTQKTITKRGCPAQTFNKITLVRCNDYLSAPLQVRKKKKDNL